jgi:hypothetical protein
VKKREIRKQKDEMTEEKKIKECLCCSSVFTLESSFTSSLVVFHVCFCSSCFNFQVCFSSSLTFMSFFTSIYIFYKTTVKFFLRPEKETNKTKHKSLYIYIKEEIKETPLQTNL